MTLVKCAFGACAVLLAAALVAGSLSPPQPGPAATTAHVGGGHPPTIDMRAFQHAFR